MAETQPLYHAAAHLSLSLLIIHPKNYLCIQPIPVKLQALPSENGRFMQGYNRGTISIASVQNKIQNIPARLCHNDSHTVISVMRVTVVTFSTVA